MNRTIGTMLGKSYLNRWVVGIIGWWLRGGGLFDVLTKWK